MHQSLDSPENPKSAILIRFAQYSNLYKSATTIPNSTIYNSVQNNIFLDEYWRELLLILFVAAEFW